MKKRICDKCEVELETFEYNYLKTNFSCYNGDDDDFKKYDLCDDCFKVINKKIKILLE